MSDLDLAAIRARLDEVRQIPFVGYGGVDLTPWFVADIAALLARADELEAERAAHRADVANLGSANVREVARADAAEQRLAGIVAGLRERIDLVVGFDALSRDALRGELRHTADDIEAGRL